MAVVGGDGKEGPPGLVIQLLAYFMDCFVQFGRLLKKHRDILLVVIPSSSLRCNRNKVAWFQSMKPYQENEDEEKVPNGLMEGT